jgi:enoyl-CoA hydratase
MDVVIQGSARKAEEEAIPVLYGRRRQRSEATPGRRPTWGMSQRLPHLIGAAHARYLSYSAATFTGRQAAEWGLVARSCPKIDLDTVVTDVADTIRANSPGSLAAYKDLYQAAERLTLPDGLSYEATSEYRIDDTESRIAHFR